MYNFCFFSNNKGRVTKVTTKGGNDQNETLLITESVNVNRIISYETELFKQSNNSSF